MHSTTALFSGFRARRSPVLAALWLAAALAGASAVAPRGAHAQRVLGPGDDATTLPVGGIRYRLAGTWNDFDRTLARTSGGPDRPLGAGLFGDTISTGWAPFLSSTRSAVRGMAGDTTLPVSLGAIRGSFEARNWVVPVGLDIGVTRWLTLGLQGSLVRNFTSAFYKVNPVGTFANLGLNPAIGSTGFAAINASVMQQITAAQASLSTQFPCVISAPTSAGCANPYATAQLLGRLASGVSSVYIGSPVAPLAGSRADTLINGQFGLANAQLRTLLGLAIDPLTTRPVGAFTRLGLTDFYNLLLSSQVGMGPDTLGPHGRVTAGDFAVSLKMKWLDTFGADPAQRTTVDGLRWRSAVQLTGTIPSGHSAVASVYSDQGTSTKAPSLELRSITDVQWSKRFWGTASVRVGQFRTETARLRLTNDSGPVLLGAEYEGLYTRQRGGWRQIDLVPRVVINDYFSVAAAYTWRSVDADRFTLTAGDPLNAVVPALATLTPNFPVPGGNRPAGLDGVLSWGGHEQRAGFGFTYSSVSARQRGKGGIPLEVSYLHQETFSGLGLPRRTTEAMELRLYWSP